MKKIISLVILIALTMNLIPYDVCAVGYYDEEIVSCSAKDDSLIPFVGGCRL